METGARPKEKKGERPKEKTKKKAKTDNKASDESGPQKSGDARERNRFCRCQGEENTLEKFNETNRAKIQALLNQNHFYKIAKNPDDEEILTTILSCASKMRKDDVDMKYLEEEIRHWVADGRHTCVLEKLLSAATENVEAEAKKHTNEELISKLDQMKLRGKKTETIVSPEARDISDALGLNKSKEEVQEVVSNMRSQYRNLSRLQKEDFKQKPIEPSEVERISVSDLIQKDSDDEEMVQTQEVRPENMELEGAEGGEPLKLLTKGDILEETKGKREKDIRSDSFARRVFREYIKVQE